MDTLLDEVRKGTPWRRMFVDDIVICSEISEQMEHNPGEVEACVGKKNESQS